MKPSELRRRILADHEALRRRLAGLEEQAGRVAGGASEYLDHRESGTAMDMRVPVDECRFLGRPLD